MWRDRAACKGQPTVWWFPVTSKHDDAGRTICKTCPVRNECLAYSLTFRPEDMHGIWAGYDTKQRYALLEGPLYHGDQS